MVDSLDLASGVRFAVEIDTRLPVVVICTRIGSGSGEDPFAHPGMAHLAEHLGFGWVGAPFDAQVHGAGGDSGGWTEPDATVFTTVIPRDAQTLAYTLEAARLVDGPRPDMAAIDAARRIVAAEARVSPRATLSRVRGALFPEGDPWHRPPIGDPEKLTTVTPDDLRTWLSSAWRPERVDIAIVGDVDLAAVLPLRERLAAWRSPSPPPIRAAAPAKGRASVGDLRAWRTAPRAHPDRPALELLAVTVGGEMVSGPDRGLFFAGPEAHWLGYARRLGEAKARVEAKFARARGDIEGRARLYAGCLSVGADADCAESELARYRAVTTADLARVRRTWLR